MACDVCNSAAMYQSIVGDFCPKHWEADALRPAYFAFLQGGRASHEWKFSAEKAEAVTREKAKE